MPVNFLSEEQAKSYGSYNEEPSEVQLTRYFYLDDTDLSVVAEQKRDYSRFGFSIQLCTVRFLGTFLSNPINVPANVIHYIGNQLKIKDFRCLEQYTIRKATYHNHARIIKQKYGYKDFHTEPEYSELLEWLNIKALMSDERPSVLFDLATSWLVKRKILLPGVTTLARIIAKVRDDAKESLYKKITSLLSEDQKFKLIELFDVDPIQRRSKLDLLRCGPTRISGNSLVSALKRVCEIRSMNLYNVDVSEVSPGRFKSLARYAMSCWASRIAQMLDDRKIATLFAFIYHMETIAIDDALDIFDMLMTDISKKAKSNAETKRIRASGDLDEAAMKLRNVCEYIIDETHKEEELRQIIYKRFPKNQIQEAILQIEHIVCPREDQYHQEMLELYGRVRRFLPWFLRTINFDGTPSAKPLLNAIKFLKNIEDTLQPDISKAPLDGISKMWLKKILNSSNRIDRQAYTLSVLLWLQESLRRRDIFCKRSDKWGDPRIKLLKGVEWESVKYEVCLSLGRERNPEKEIAKLKEDLNQAYQQTIKNFPLNNDVHIEKQNGKERLVLKNLDKQEEPESLLRLRSIISQRLPVVDLPEVLLEIHALTGFADEFTHITESQSRIEDLPISVCAVLLAEACNTGFDPVVRKDHTALTLDRLHWVQQNYIRSDTLVNANMKLVEVQTRIPLAQKWGGGEVASADGLRFVTPIRTINSGPNPKYFKAKRGITYYNFSSDQFTGFHGIVIPGTLRDSLFILQGLLEQQTILRPTEIMADTAGVSNIVFGLFWLLGFQFSPRLADIGDARFWKLEHDADYGVLNKIASHTLNPNRIVYYWEDMLRIAGSLKMGKIRASDLLQSILKSKKPSKLTQAIADLGKISKTIYMLNYFDDKIYRRRILTQLNRGEGRNMLARTICYGKRGEIRKRYREGQEDQLGALGLVVNIVILWQTIYMNAILEQLKIEGYEINDEDVYRLSPLRHKNINVLGRYSFILDESIKNGKLRTI